MNLEDCRCIPRKDKEDLTTAIGHAKKFYDISIIVNNYKCLK